MRKNHYRIGREGISTSSLSCSHSHKTHNLIWLRSICQVKLRWATDGLAAGTRRCFKGRRIKQLAHTDGAFKLPVKVGRANLVGSLLRLYQIWDPSDLAHSDRRLMSKSSLDLLTTSLDLPHCFPFDFASRKPVPIRLKVNKTSSGDNLGIVPSFSYLTAD